MGYRLMGLTGLMPAPQALWTSYRTITQISRKKAWIYGIADDE